IAANGGTKIIAASDAIFPIIPTNTTTYVTNEEGAFVIVFLITYSNKPTFSAKPTPNIIAMTIPNGANPVKFVIMFSNIYCNPSPDSKFLTSNVFSLPGGLTVAPYMLNINESTTTTNAKYIKRKNG